MNNKQPLLSICIPTYNRCQYLTKTLDSIIEQPEFNSENVEIVISDNCSTDNTQNACLEYTKKFSNIKYHRNIENIADKNFPLVLSEGSGVLLKLCNDTLLFNTGALAYLLDIVKNYQISKDVVFTKNSGLENDTHTSSLDEFLYAVSFNITWIGGLCVWKEDFKDLASNEEGCEKKLWQVPFLLNYVNHRKNALVCNKTLFTRQSEEKKNISYGLYTVFYENYLGFVRNYLNSKEISQECFSWLEKDLLFSFFPYWMIQFKLKNKHLVYSKSENLIKSIFTAYKKKPYYKEFRSFYGKLYFNEVVKPKLKHFIKKILWFV
ncbi:MAG: glycosyltransferase family 2 protein [Clostridia bacterium]|nr:glycosyltransferase family 2 protein [Clostridia bacterium]